MIYHVDQEIQVILEIATEQASSTLPYLKLADHELSAGLCKLEIAASNKYRIRQLKSSCFASILDDKQEKPKAQEWISRSGGAASCTQHVY